ncbi:MAG: type II secretion system protein [Candidatus Omnitrophota bacterium]|nr:type II secretion system protein [Candidatus Omnitrophota bacterium]
MSKKTGFTLIELTIVAAIFLLVMAALGPFVHMAKSRANRISCANNLRKISLGLHMYAADHKDIFPPDIDSLYPDYVDDPNVFDCPATKKAGKKSDPDYSYTTGLTEVSSPKEIIAQDIDTNHKRRGKNAVRINGSVEWISAGR